MQLQPVSAIAANCSGRQGLPLQGSLGAHAFDLRMILRLAFAVLVAGLLAACTTSEALRIPTPNAASSKYAAIVVDVRSGETLYSVGADLQRYPASLTKMMTIYMLLEALDSNRVTKETLIPVSDVARNRPPSKLGLKPGQSVNVDTAIRALVVKSANDVATAVAEYLGGSEAQFAAMMTGKARDLGMTRTTFRNASGLPDSAQRTTARDMARLSIALRQRFPHHYHYFSLRQFTFQGRTVRGHNKVLEQIPGADGLKTGYIRASGFNLATSVSRSGRRLVAVVMGGNSARSRDEHMVVLVHRFLPRASAPAARGS